MAKDELEKYLRRIETEEDRVKRKQAKLRAEQEQKMAQLASP